MLCHISEMVNGCDLFDTLTAIGFSKKEIFSEFPELETAENTPAATPEEPQNLCVCEHCLMAIESREGQQITRKIYLDDDDPRPCDWCDETENDILYEIL